MFGLFVGSLTLGAQRAVHQVRMDPVARWFAIAVVVANAVAIGMPIAMELLDLKIPAHLDVMYDNSWPERLNYAQTAACAALLALLWFRERQMVLLALAVTFMAVCLDDMLQYHENFGRLLSKRLHLPALPGLRAIDSGELLAMAIAGAVFLPLIGLALREGGALASGLAPVLIACLAALAFCGAGLDMLHIAANGSQIVGYLEDGGEMLAMAAACIAAFAFLRPPARSQVAGAVPIHQ